MMRKTSLNSLILFVFCSIILMLIFLDETSRFTNLFLKLCSILGLIWVVYYFSKSQNIFDDTYNKEAGEQNNRQVFDHNPDSQFSNLIDTIFSLTKDINVELDGAVYFFQPDSNTFEIKNCTSNTFVESISAQSDLIRSINKKNKQLVIYQKNNQKYWLEFSMDEKLRGSEVAILQPLFINKVVAGVLIIRSEHFSAVDDEVQTITRHLGEILNIGILDLDLLEKTINSKNDQSQVFDLLTQINLSQSESDILNKFRNIINYYFKYDCLTFSAINQNGNIAYIKLVDGLKKHLPSENSFNINGTINGLPYLRGNLISSNSDEYNLYRFSSSEKNDELHINFLSIPLFINEILWGAITIENFGLRRFSDRDEKLIKLIARALQTSMSWFVEYHNIYEDAIKDGLTGLLNHKTFIDRAREEIERARRFQHQLVFLIYDLDKFKRINDTLGHPYGDYVIKTTAQIIKANVRSIDLVARYGGEEFAVVLVNTNKEAATTVAKRIVKNVKDHNFNMNNDKVDMTISCGLSEYPKDSDNLKDLIQFADEGLYKTKDKGGDDVTIYGSF